MRTLKFRIYDNLKKEWVRSTSIFWFVTNETGDGKILAPIMYSQGGKERLTIQQFTGLTDSNGKEIYEGDFIRLFVGDKLFGYGKVIYSEEDAAFIIREFSSNITNEIVQLDYTFQDILKSCRKFTLQVAGNILDNPDLSR